MAYDSANDANEIPFSPGDEEEIIAYLLSLSPEERKRQAWDVMMNGIPKNE